MELSFDLFAALRTALLLAAFGGFAWALLRTRREHAAQLDRVHTLQRELIAQVHTLAERTGALATLVATLPGPRAPEEPSQPRSRREPAQVRCYETARRLARAGAGIDEIVASSGLASSEARLLRRLHGADEHGNVA